ncbi:hypothetical protein PSAB_20530 [Paenibacillus sabinae T27]|uniref:Uncharacterized protein n=1 Tax=Paenibacillus sabinae T27 TaxID=1268072 RepID=X4ZP86_9BACL|nr:hypothetical protein PSAB_20530 [Paenibacillus sabinae T27]
MYYVWVALCIVHAALAAAGLYADLRFRLRYKERVDYFNLAFICVLPALYWALVYVFSRYKGGWI